jgi:hypothetical protein
VQVPHPPIFSSGSNNRLPKHLNQAPAHNSHLWPVPHLSTQWSGVLVGQTCLLPVRLCRKLGAEMVGQVGFKMATGLGKGTGAKQSLQVGWTA